MGFYLYSNANYNLINNNNISTSGAATSNAFYLLWVAAGYPENNIIQSSFKNLINNQKGDNHQPGVFVAVVKGEQKAKNYARTKMQYWPAVNINIREIYGGLS